jgi:hypothetical protein
MPAAATDKFKKTGTDRFSTTLAAPGKAEAASSINLSTVSGLPTDTGVSVTLYQTQTDGSVDVSTVTTWNGIVSGSQITNLALASGTDQAYNAGDKVTVFWSSAHWDTAVDGILVDHNQSGYHKSLTDANGNDWIKQAATASAVNEITVRNAATGSGPRIEASGDDTNIDLSLKPKGTGKLVHRGMVDGWLYDVLPAVSSVSYNGQRSYDITFASTVASILNPGMRLRTTRTVTAPTQCTSLNGTTQYFNKTSPAGTTFTGTFTTMGWVKLTSYAQGVIISRSNGSTDNTGGWHFELTATGQPRIFYGTSSNFTDFIAYQSIPLNRWVHVAGVVTSIGSKTGEIYIDGVLVPNYSTFTAATTLTQSSVNLTVGARPNGSVPFPGKLAQVAVFSTNLSASTLRSYMSQTLTGSETNLVSAYSFNNSINDLNTTNANNLSAQGSAVATNSDSPYAEDANGTPGGTYDYAIVTKISAAVATVQVPEGCTIPTTGGVSATETSNWQVPFGFTLDINRWEITTLVRQDLSSGANPTGFQNLNAQITVPVGSMTIGYATTSSSDRSGAGTLGHSTTLSTTTSTQTDSRLTQFSYNASGNSVLYTEHTRSAPVTLTSATPYYLLIAPENAGTYVNVSLRGTTSNRGDVVIYALPAGI